MRVKLQYDSSFKTLSGGVPEQSTLMVIPDNNKVDLELGNQCIVYLMKITEIPQV